MPQLHTQGRSLAFSTDDIRLGRLLVNVQVPDMDYIDLVTDKLSPSDVQITNTHSGYNQWDPHRTNTHSGYNQWDSHRTTAGGGRATPDSKRLSATRRSPLLAPDSKQKIVFRTPRVSRYELTDSDRLADKIKESQGVVELLTNQILAGKVENAPTSGPGLFTAHLVVGYTTFLNPRSVVLVKDKLASESADDETGVSSGSSSPTSPVAKASPSSPVDVDADLWETALAFLRDSAPPHPQSKTYSKIATCAAWGERLAGVKTRRLVVSYTIHVNPRALASKLRSSSRTLTIDGMRLLDDDPAAIPWTMLWGQAYNAGHVLAIIGGGLQEEEEDIQPLNLTNANDRPSTSTSPVSPSAKSASPGLSPIETKRKEIPGLGNLLLPSTLSPQRSTAREDNGSILQRDGSRVLKPDSEPGYAATVDRTSGASSVLTTSPPMYSRPFNSWNQTPSGNSLDLDLGMKRDSLGLFIFTAEYQNPTASSIALPPPPASPLKTFGTQPEMAIRRKTLPVQNYPPRILIPTL